MELEDTTGLLIEKCRVSKLTSAEESLHFIVVAGHDEKEGFRPVLEYQPDFQPGPNLKKISGQLANAQPPMPERMADILLQLPERPSDFAARFAGIISYAGSK